MGGVEHRRDVVHLAGDGGDVLGDLLRPGGGDAEDGRAEERVVRREPPPRLREEVGDRLLGSLVEAGHDHRVERPVRPANVVVEDVVDAELRRRDGEIDVVRADGGMDVAREPAVAAGVRAAVRRLDHEVAPAVRPRPLGEHGVAERHEPADHPRAARVEELHGRAEVVRVPLGADPSARAARRSASRRCPARP